MINVIEWLLLIFFSIMMKKWLVLRNMPISRLECEDHTPFMTKLAKIGQNRYPIHDQNGWKTILFGAAHTYIAYIREYPPGPLSRDCLPTLTYKLPCNLAVKRNYFASCWLWSKPFFKLLFLTVIFMRHEKLFPSNGLLKDHSSAMNAVPTLL